MLLICTCLSQKTSGAAAVLLLLLLLLLVAACSASPLFLLPSKERMEVAPAIRGPDVKLGDGDVVGGKNYIYKCKICDMPRIFVMDYGSFIHKLQ